MENSTSIFGTSPSTIPHMILHEQRITFSWVDYVLFSTMIVLSLLIGLYFGCFGKKQNNISEYLMGGKTMSVLPIAVSLIAGHSSSVAYLAIPADVYRYGSGYWLSSIGMFIVAFITCFIYLPVFYKLQVTSVYEYLAKRFDEKTRMMASFLFTLSYILYLPIVIYVPALAFSSATGFNVHFVTPIMCSICIFYTTIGGLKAVVWTDTLQFVVTMGAFCTIFILGLITAGGFTKVWETARHGERLGIDFDIDPTKRDSFWIVVFGMTLFFTSEVSVNQSCVQKFMAVPTLKKAKRAVFLYCIGYIFVRSLSCLTGLIMYSIYEKCDPFTTKQISRNDELVPYFVVHIAQNIPGLSGLFISGVFSAALSTLSACLNCLAGSVYTDFVSKFMPPKTTEQTASVVLKILVVIIGIISTLMVYLVEHLGGMLKLSIIVKGITDGSLMGMFTMGLMVRRSNSKGAFYGSLISLICMSIIIGGATYYESQGEFEYEPKPLSTEACNFTFSNFNSNTTFAAYNSTLKVSENVSKPFVLFRISYYYFTLLGAIIFMVFGVLISYLTNKDDIPVHKDLLSPLIYFTLPKEEKNINDGKEYYQVNKAMQMLSTNSEPS